MLRTIKTKRLTLGVALGANEGRVLANAGAPRFVRLRSTRIRGGTLWFSRGRVWFGVGNPGS